MSQHIHCIVNDCEYWKQGNMCVANEILVTTDKFGQNQPTKIDACTAKQLTPQNAGNCVETCCKTYTPKSKSTTNTVNKLF